MSGAELSSYIPKQTDNCVYDLLLPLDIKGLSASSVFLVSITLTKKASGKRFLN